ncbi:MAG: hypothetical protein Q9208_002501 [Pyrenodesmia sp. 3 TL-2023]
MLPISALSDDYFESAKIVIKDLASRQGDAISSIIDVPILTQSKVPVSDNRQHFRLGADPAGISHRSPRERAPQLQNILPGMRTVYHLPFLTVKLANELWNAGFRDIDTPDEYYRTPLMIIGWLCRWFFENVPTEHLPIVSSQEILRLVTFEKLGLRHTCCEVGLNGIYDVYAAKPEEVAEIRDEDHEGIQLLESLLSEFEEKRGDENIKSFINGYWSTRMEELLAARDEESVDRIALREIGVVFDDENGSGDVGMVTE